MLARLRHRSLQRALAALLVGALLSVAGAAHACKTVQLLSLAGVAAASLHAVPETAHAHDVAIGAAAHQPADLLRHGGPCHLLIAVALPTGESQLGNAALPTSWPAAPAPGFSSRIWPPPKHRPRAA
ncbi:hypothetical protein [Azohydromonas caseinilytica]|uniref:Uncharacterized protein n=1 Tax=Azohydromonas caseinilytica TaxID=2728836 RepID=A0A848FFM0_9BURK|nr:hypothetical protein [Azohydromonas caseinilytica]NML18164.1 hypothetical protein [Azohydromonas caseinilytica]